MPQFEESDLPLTGHAKHLSKLDWRVTAAWAALFLAALACSRAEVPASEALAAANPPQASPPPAAVEASATPAPSPTPSLPPTVVPTATPAAPVVPLTPTLPATPTAFIAGAEQIVYKSQPGDTLRTLAIRFAVLPEEIISADGPLPGENELVPPDTTLVIPRRLGPTGPSEPLIPDSELVFSPHAADFDVSAFTAEQGGFLNQYQEYLGKRWRTGPEVVALAAQDHSINPRILLALLEYHSGWVTDPSRPAGDAFRYPLGNKDPQYQGLYRQLTWLSNLLGEGYYGWRQGLLTELSFSDGSVVRLAPELNAGTVALQYYFSKRFSGRAWAEALGPEGFIATYRKFFGEPWDYYHPLFEPGVKQPPMILPFLEGRVWAFTGGPHGAWEREAAWAALDLAPGSVEPGCKVSEDWAVAAASGLVVRTGEGLVVIDLDGDGREQTGWVLIYLHVASEDRVQQGTFVEQGDLIGHPSCEGGIATGSHIHFVRKYNGEWVLADGPLPFELSGWVARAGSKPYQGALVKGDQVVLACPCASQETLISR